MSFKDRNLLLVQKQINKKATAHAVDTRKNYSGQKVVHPPAIYFQLPVNATSHSASHMAATRSE